MGDKRYHEQYWKANRKRLLKARAERYRKDKAFRAAAITRSRAKVAISKILRAGTIKKVWHDGQWEPQYTITDLAKAADRSKDVIYRWRQQGIIPPATHRDARNNSLYSESQLAYVKSVCTMIDSGGLGVSYIEMGKILAAVWSHTWYLGRLNNVIMEGQSYGAISEGDSKKGDRKTRNHISSQERGSDSDEGKDAKVRRRARSSPRKHGRNKEHGELRVPTNLSRSVSPMLTCPGRRSIRQGSEVR